MTRLPSRLAIWLMTRFGVGDAIVGDIQEHGEHSSMWLWWQAIGAIVVAVRKDFSTHWIVAIRAIIFGMVVWKFLFPYIGVVVPGIHVTTVASMFLGLPATVCLGWAIARLHPTRTPMPVMAFLTAVCLTWHFPYARQFSNVIGDSRFRPYLFTQTLSICIFMVGVLSGGLWAGKGRRMSRGVLGQGTIRR